ncbi:MAG: NAD(+) synthase [Dehalococcoidales bacterium]|nr:NAD(+) synthase [Dehalococcoidales bacterium]
MDQEITLNRDLGFLRIAAAVPLLKVAEIDYNVESILEMIKQAFEEGVQVVAFPEMSITGYTLGDLVQQQALLNKAEKGLERILAGTAEYSLLVLLGLPLCVEQKVFNCAVAINAGKILGVVPKTYLPSYKEFYDDRWFEQGTKARTTSVRLCGKEAPFGTDLLFRTGDAVSTTIGVEICEDLWVPFAPHEYQSVAGASLIFNLSASNEILGKSDWRRVLAMSESGRCLACYCFVSSGIGESSNDVVYGGHAIIAENGTILAESARLRPGPQMITADVDLERLAFDRRMGTSFQQASEDRPRFRLVETSVRDIATGMMKRALDAHPFVPADPSGRTERCREVFSMQVGGLAKKLSGAKKQKIVLGISGGLDSTLALLVAVKTMDFLGLPRSSIHAFTLPGFGTTRRTRSNATRLCKALGLSCNEADITRTCTLQLKDLGHSGSQDIVFENVQARYRTAFLFNKANELDAIMLGTGDLTEVALGWSTFAGDQVSHYHVNVSVPKTLVRYLISWVADEDLRDTPARKLLNDILATPISPELLRPAGGRISQKSEDIIGPVELADYFLYPFIRFGIRPGKILFMANEVRKQGLFDGQYSLEDLNKWLQSFIRRFFANQFKRTCMPEGPKVGTISLSPRGDWRMPSDAEPRLWLEDLEEMYRRLKNM